MRFDRHIKPRLRRAGLFGFSVITLITAVAYASPLIRNQENYLPNLWPIWFAMTAGLLFLYALKPWHYQLYRWCGFFLIPATASRIGAIVLRWLTTDTIEWERAVIGVCIYTVTAGVLLSWWFEVVRPWRAKQAVERLQAQGHLPPAP